MIPSAAGLFLITVLISIHGSQQADCDENEFQCTNGECIDSFLVCDGEANCQDASDETKHVCSKSHVVCQPFAFRCAYGACIDGIKKCDGNKDCADNSDENLPECKKSSSNSSSTNNCLTGPGHFQCNSGQCIDEWVVCDGELDCRDGSDESDTVCVNFPCPQILGFQCSYGGCIDKLKQCNGVKDCRDNSDEDPLFCAPPSTTSPGRPSTSPITMGCKLPRRPKGGLYQVSGCHEDDLSDMCRRVPNTLVPQLTQLTYHCDEGFRLSGTLSERRCINSSWFPTESIECLELCNGLRSNSVDMICSRQDSPVECSEPALPGTRVKLKCKSSFTYVHGSGGSNEIICGRNGQWSDVVYRCVPDCGIRTGNITSTLISKGQNSSAVEYPWHAGLYRYDGQINKVELFCGGSIITPFIILTVAHCVYENRRTIDAKDVIVAVGKTIRDFDVVDPLEQRFNVSKIFVHPDYRGDENNYAFDIAMLELPKSIVIGRVTMPVCRERVPPWTVIPNQTNGTVVGWGKDENGQLNEILQVVNLPYLDPESCKQGSPFVFKKFITPDKFCATYIEGAGVQKGDSGGGLVFQKSQNGLYFIHGLVSTKIADENKFATFTNVSSKADFDFIEETIKEVNNNHII